MLNDKKKISKVKNQDIQISNTDEGFNYPYKGMLVITIHSIVAINS